jgi:hypothetical protein
LLEVFRPTIPDIEDLIEAPEVAKAKIESMQLQDLGPDMIKALPGLMAGQQAEKQQQEQQIQQRAVIENQMKEQQESQDLAQQKMGVDTVKVLAEIDEIYAKIKQMQSTPTVATKDK